MAFIIEVNQRLLYLAFSMPKNAEKDMQQPFRRRYNKFSCKVTKKNGNLSAFKYLFAPQCRNDPAFFTSKAMKAVDAEDIAEVRSDGALVADKIRPFGKKQTSLREETNVSS